MRDVLIYGGMAMLAAAVLAVIWLSSRYQSYLNQTRNGSGKKPKPVWKPFWYD
ncbi:hypothetical protein [Tsuneonella sp. HG222]